MLNPTWKTFILNGMTSSGGGFGGIERVVLHRNSLTLFLSPRMAKQMGEHDSIRIEFATNQHEFREMQHVLGLIMRGYESQLKLLS